MKKYKKLIIIVVITVLIVGGIIGGIYYAVSKNNKNHTVDAVNIGYVCTYDYDYGSSSISGTIRSGGGQNVYLSEGDIISQVLVKEGDSVQEGTPLIALDSNKLKMELDSCNLKLQQDDLNIQLANKMIDKYKKAVPYVEPTEPVTEEPETDEPDNTGISTDNILSEINSVSQAFEGDGSSVNPYKFKAAGNCILHEDIFKAIEGNNMYINLYIYSEDVDAFTYMCALSPTGKNTSIKEGYTWKVGYIYDLADGTSTIQLNRKLPPVNCEFTTYTPDIPDDIEPDTDDIDDTQDTPEPDPDDVNSSIDGVYTQEELNSMISDKQKELAELTIERKEDELAAKKAQNKYNAATITSTVTGVVTSVNTDAGSTDPVMVISDSAGMYVKTVVDEYNYNKIKVGDPIYISSWSEDGNSQIEAKITSISPYPASDNSFYYSSNKNVSFYPVTALVDSSSGLTEDDYINVSFTSSSGTDGSDDLAIDKAYIGSDDKGSFLYLVNDKGYLEKTYVKTGKTVMDSYLVIKDEIDTNGYIASPYSKYAKDGVKAKIKDEY